MIDFLVRWAKNTGIFLSFFAALFGVVGLLLSGAWLLVWAIGQLPVHNYVRAGIFVAAILVIVSMVMGAAWATEKKEDAGNS